MLIDLRIFENEGSILRELKSEAFEKFKAK